jgi:hypothetical protein
MPLTLLQIPTTGYPPRNYYASKPRMGRREQPQRELGTAVWFSPFRQVLGTGISIRRLCQLK